MTTLPVPHTYLITYDIPDDDRRSDISDLLAAHGARVQYSVFEVSSTDRSART
ncbi:CRISPR-associated endonuclease Cas2 [Streptomyces sp. TRM68367]|uniref:CRISPR-associated endonuclease Cas2 n=1 Tax=Streptomyces sp. TRM68367 TaxID=2758415 RepID=UPI001CA89775